MENFESLFDKYDITIESRMTADNWNELIEDVNSSLVCQLLTLSCYNLLSNAMEEGYNIAVEKLGDFWNQKGFSCSRKRTYYPLTVSDMNKILNDFGDLFYKYEEIPVVVIKGKETKEITKVDCQSACYAQTEDINNFMEVVKSGNYYR